MTKDEAYLSVRAQLASALEGCPDFIARMATTAALLKDSFEQILWVGFYLPQDDGSLLVGPYQGPLASPRLPAGKGVCGRAAALEETVVVPDVHAFEGHIACDPRSRSEIVVPVMGGGRLRAVLDVDSDRAAAFDETDGRHLEAIAALLADLPPGHLPAP